MFLFLFCISLSVAVFLAANFFLSGIISMETEGRVHNAVEKKKSKSFIMPVILKRADKIGRLLSKIKYKRFKDFMSKLQSDLNSLGTEYAGYNAYQYFVLCLFSMFAGILFFVCCISIDIIGIIFAAALFFALPLLKIRDSVKKRREKIFKQLPDTADLLSVMLEAGMDFFSAADKVNGVLKGPLTDDFKDALAKISLGYDKKAALTEMSDKNGSQQLAFFVKTINMALDAGVGMAETLRRLSERLREERASAAEKKAQEAPVKMLVPMVLFIFPTIFIVIFGPIVINFMMTGSF